MKEGLAIVVTPGGYAPYVRIGWVVREDGWIRLLNSRVIRRFGTSQQLAGLAKTGPAPSTQLLDCVPEEGCHVGTVSRWIPADPESWAVCPKPEGE